MTGYGRVENQKQVSHSVHSPWKSLARFPHFHRPGGCSGKVESQNQASHFPTAYCLWNKFKNQITKGGLAPVTSFPAPGSFFDEKML